MSFGQPTTPPMTPPTTSKTPAEVARLAHYHHPEHPWESCGKDEREHWNKVAQAVLAAFPAQPAGVTITAEDVCSAAKAIERETGFRHDLEIEDAAIIAEELNRSRSCPAPQPAAKSVELKPMIRYTVEQSEGRWWVMLGKNRCLDFANQELAEASATRCNENLRRQENNAKNPVPASGFPKQVYWSTGDMVETPGNGCTRLYTVEAILHGGWDGESIIQLDAVDRRAPNDVDGKSNAPIHVPVEMLEAGIRAGIFTHTKHDDE